MTPKMFQTSLAVYHQAIWEGKNTSGWDALGDHIVVKPDQCAPVSQGGIHITDDLVERMTMAAEAGVVVSVGESSFKFNTDGTSFKGRKPKPGERVSIGRYAGQLLKGHDGETYRIMNASELGAIEVKND